MSDTTDAAVGAVAGLMAVGIMANVAGNMMRPQRPYYMDRPARPRRAKKKKVKKGYRMGWIKN